jgi:hypothetical protein
MAVPEPADQSHQALHAANEQRSIEASRRNRKLAATALMRLGADCQPEWEDVATEVILHSQYSWSEIAGRLGVTRNQAVYRFRRLLSAAGVEVEDNGTSDPDAPGAELRPVIRVPRRAGPVAGSTTR